jgi:SsrA-binding protein
MKKKKDNKNNATINRKAYHDYEIISKHEAGLVLLGTEVKAVREGRVNLKDSYIDVKSGQAILIGAHIGQYSNANINNHEPERSRKLLLHRREINKFLQKVLVKGVSIIPLRMYFNEKGRLKIEIALAKGKRSYDKKTAIKERDIKREVDRELKNYR